MPCPQPREPLYDRLGRAVIWRPENRSYWILGQMFDAGLAKKFGSVGLSLFRAQASSTKESSG